MAHYALLDENNVVVRVFVGVEEYKDNVDWEHHYGAIHNMTCKRTSYNTCGNKHRGGGTPFRKNFAAAGDLYDEERDAFIPPSPFNSFVLNEDTCEWGPPIEKPELTEEQYNECGMWVWDEALWESDNTKGWVYHSDSTENVPPKEEIPINSLPTPPEDGSIVVSPPTYEEEPPEPLSDFPAPVRRPAVVGQSIHAHLIGNPESDVVEQPASIPMENLPVPPVE